jgi:hypothetical protein
LSSSFSKRVEIAATGKAALYLHRYHFGELLEVTTTGAARSGDWTGRGGTGGGGRGGGQRRGRGGQGSPDSNADDGDAAETRALLAAWAVARARETEAEEVGRKRGAGAAANGSAGPGPEHHSNDAAQDNSKRSVLSDLSGDAAISLDAAADAAESAESEATAAAGGGGFLVVAGAPPPTTADTPNGFTPAAPAGNPRIRSRSKNGPRSF